jgi:hypothetical protein
MTDTPSADMQSLLKLKKLIDKLDKQWVDEMPPLTATYDEENDMIHLVDPDGRSRMWMPAEVYVDIIKYKQEKENAK